MDATTTYAPAPARVRDETPLRYGPLDDMTPSMLRIIRDDAHEVTTRRAAAAVELGRRAEPTRRVWGGGW